MREILASYRRVIEAILHEGAASPTQQLIALHKDFAKQAGGVKSRIPLLSIAWATYMEAIDIATAMPSPHRETAVREISKRAVDGAMNRWQRLPAVGK
ncbi:MAG: hypothetical protein ACKVP7_04075 [Hyphomicrobiaceae bacterium]